ncbi:MAG: hypothetical protein ACPGJV_03125 [Bacteriovoracaceae bacterium]
MSVAGEGTTSTWTQSSHQDNSNRQSVIETRSDAHNIENHSEESNVSLDTISDITGFPVDYIKKELLLESDYVTLGNLRKVMLNYLDKTMKEE